MAEKNKKTFKMPHTFVIMMVIILFATLLTWIIPAGQYVCVENADGVKVVDPNQFSFIDRCPVNPLLIPLYIVNSMCKRVDLMLVIIFSGGAFDLISKSGALHSAVARVAKVFQNRLYIFIPIMLPVCKALGYDVVAFGVMATVNLAIGQVTPPVGVNLFVAISIKIKKGLEVTLQQISRAVMPMIAASVAVLLIVTYIPATSTALPKALAKDGSYTGDQASADTGSTSSKDAGDGSDSFNTIEDYSDLDWPEMTWNFACSTTETSTWADGGRKFGELMEKATGGKVKVNVYATDQLTNGNQSEGIQALMNGDPVQISMHSNLIYSAFDPRFNVVSLPFIYDSYDDADAKFDGEAGEKLKEILSSYGLHCMGIAENGFRELTNSKHEVKTVDDLKNLKIRVAGSNLLMECYKRWGADATNMNWSETYTALQQNTVEGQENPLPAIDAASVQEVQPYCSMWDAIYDCLFFCINQDLYDTLTPEQQAVVDECGQKAVEYERYINRSGDEEIKTRWQSKNGVTITDKDDMDIDSFKEAVDGVDEWFVEQLKDAGYDDGQELVDLFEK